VCITAKRKIKSMGNEDFLIESTDSNASRNSRVRDPVSERTDFTSPLFYQQFCNGSSTRFFERKLSVNSLIST
jgi:hypothetical protein